jgi:hypothetical protein
MNARLGKSYLDFSDFESKDAYIKGANLPKLAWRSTRIRIRLSKSDPYGRVDIRQQQTATFVRSLHLSH